MFAADAPARLVAIFDWDLPPSATRSLISGTCCRATQPTDGPAPLAAIASLTHGEGFPSPDDVIARYEAQTGFAVDDVAWYEALAHWRLAVILEGSYRRLLAGSTDDACLSEMSSVVPELAEENPMCRLSQARP